MVWKFRKRIVFLESVLILFFIANTSFASPPTETPSVKIKSASNSAGPGARQLSLKREPTPCLEAEDTDIALMVLPPSPTVGQPIRVLAIVGDPAEKMEMVVTRTSGEKPEVQRKETWGYTPQALSHLYSELDAGEYRAVLKRSPEASTSGCLEFTVSDPQIGSPSPPENTDGSVWKIVRGWDAGMENLFSVFVAKLFYVRPGLRKGWKPLHQALRDPERNILHNILGLDEDNPEAETPVRLEPDCGDAPYHVRAYFAWKMGLPFIYNRCRRGNAIKGARCVAERSNLTNALDEISDPVERFNQFAKTKISWEVHAGNPRSAPDADVSDFYPIGLDSASLRPGVVFVDAGGHVLLVTQVEPQTQSSIGALYGVDAHPDRTVTHKRFSKGSFVFHSGVPTDGFKAFRPIATREGEPSFLVNSEIDVELGHLAYSKEQAQFEEDDHFYNAVFSTLNPEPVDPRQVLEAKVEVLYQAMIERTEAVQIGVKYMKQRDWSLMSMPKGSKIFQTSGPWETYSTPARDMRCFIALDDVMEFPKLAAKQIAVYSVAQEMDETALLKDLEAFRDELLKKLTFKYKRSDESEWTLSLMDVVERQKELEMAYNPNDCPETRWAAPKGSEEAETCNRKAPLEQLRRMRLARRWFATRNRPN